MSPLDDTAAAAPLFNSPLETGLRAIVVLDALHPRACDLTELTWFDHLVVHTGDLGGPASLHPDLPGRTGELFVRRRLVEESLRLMHRVHLVDMVTDENGIQFVAGDDAPSFIDLLQTPYSLALRDCARWLADRFGDRSPAEIEAIVSERIGRWTAEFQSGRAGEDAAW